MLAACAHEEPPPTVTVEPLPTVASTSAPSASTTAPVASAIPTSSEDAPMPDEPRFPNVAAVAAMRPGIRRCYNAEIKTNRSAQGKIVLEIRVAGDGRVTSAALRGTSPFSSRMEQCVLGVARAAAFDAPGGSGLTLVVPFTLVSAQP